MKHKNLLNCPYEMFQNYPDMVEVTALCEMLGGISKKLAYKLLKSGSLYSLKLGREYRIPKVAVINYCMGQSEFLTSTSTHSRDMLPVAHSKPFPKTPNSKREGGR